MRPPVSKRHKRNSSRVNLVCALVFHLLLAFVAFFWAAREGTLGRRLREITVAIVPPEKPPEPEKPPPPPVVPPKEEPKVQPEPPPEPIPKLVELTQPPPAAVAAVAPAAAVLPDFDFNDGAKVVETGTNAAILNYKSQVEYSLRSNWHRPDDMEDFGYASEVELAVSESGRITNYVFKAKSGNEKWDASVASAIVATRGLNFPPPKGLPNKFIVRFDVLATEPRSDF